MLRPLLCLLFLVTGLFAQTPWGGGTVKPSGATVGLPLDTYLSVVKDVRNYGAKEGDTSFDSTAAFHAAIAALPASGGTVQAMGRYACNITITKSNVRIIGSSMSDTSTTYSVLVPFNLANPVITIGDDTGYLYGVRLDNIS